MHSLDWYNLGILLRDGSSMALRRKKQSAIGFGRCDCIFRPDGTLHVPEFSGSNKSDYGVGY
ncbi:hypothetical protein HanXRQr2_Chr09g0393771 [Helianthus annuus]|uniref:Uncharacterized protein n=1 Tax=Helianthus annuus TaxID=4232 RepID=A0A9K3I724_HELAN|nr:hypothetical protein HanXRQr2_Chr09g0393771 [Helianthus annuus]KAJ0542822.1 hypothetical protein HanHA89_Chr09g0344071 [Helianthus annuus]